MIRTMDPERPSGGWAPIPARVTIVHGMLRMILVALRGWAVRHVLRSKDQRYGDGMLFDDILVYMPEHTERKVR
jgi:hypothetical protein